MLGIHPDHHHGQQEQQDFPDLEDREIRIRLPENPTSKANPTSEDKVLMMLVDCGEIGGIQWTVDGAKADGYTNLRKGEHYVQAVLTKTDGTVEYFARYINVIL